MTTQRGRSRRSTATTAPTCSRSSAVDETVRQVQLGAAGQAQHREAAARLVPSARRAWRWCPVRPGSDPRPRPGGPRSASRRHGAAQPISASSVWGEITSRSQPVWSFVIMVVLPRLRVTGIDHGTRASRPAPRRQVVHRRPRSTAPPVVAPQAAAHRRPASFLALSRRETPRPAPAGGRPARRRALLPRGAWPPRPCASAGSPAASVRPPGLQVSSRSS